MSEIVTDAVVLRAMDYKDNDKIVFLLSPTEGKISAVLKGVKKAAAKLKYAGEPFCFAEFVLVKRGGMATVINCTQTESFYQLRQDVEAYYCGCAALEIAYAMSAEGQPNPGLFAALLKALKSTAQNKKAALIEYILDVLDNFGQKPVFDNCAECGSADVRFFDFSSGGALCARHAGRYAVVMDDDARRVLSDAADGRHLSAGDVPQKKALALLGDIFAGNFKKINSISQLLLL